MKSMHNNLLFLTVLLTFLLASEQKNDQYVLLISFDGFRADYLDWYNTPNFDRFSKNGVRASGMKPSFVTKTFPNHYSIATGMYVENHGLIGNKFYDQQLDDYYTLRDRDKVEDARFYDGEPIWVTAEKQGVKAASFFWVGSEAPIGSVYPSRWKRYDHGFPFIGRIDSIVQWFALPIHERPRLCLLYFHQPDATGHDFGPRSPETEAMVIKMDSLFGVLIEKTSELEIYPQLNIIAVSDHGMAEISSDRTVNLSKHTNMGAIIHEGTDPYAMLYSENKAEVEKAVIALKKVPHISVYLKNEIPDRFHFKNHYRIKDALVLADEGWYINNQAISTSSTAGAYVHTGGTHGYDNDLKSMHAIFLAQGPAFKINYSSSVINNIDIYPLIAHILKLEPFSGIDGKLENVQGLLKQ